MTEILLAIALTLLAREVVIFTILKIIGRATPEMHRLKINTMRRVVRDEEEIFAEKHGHPVDEPDPDPIDHPEDYR